MSHIETDKDANILLVTIDAVLTHDTMTQLRSDLDDYINREDQIPGLVIMADDRPHWDSLSTFKEHLKLVRNHHKLILKVAAVGDSAIFSAIPHLVDHFVGAKIRHFRSSDVDAAKAWASTVDDHPGEFKLLDGFPRDVLAIEANGIITSQDYEKTLKPRVAEMEKEHDQLKLYFHTGEAFRGCSGGALWDDTRFGIAHLTTFSKMAIVTDMDWLRHALKIFGPLWPGQIMAFEESDDQTAREWIKA